MAVIVVNWLEMKKSVCWVIDIAQRSDDQKIFNALPKRCVIKRTFSNSFIFQSCPSCNPANPVQTIFPILYILQS